MLIRVSFQKGILGILCHRCARKFCHELIICSCSLTVTIVDSRDLKLTLKSYLYARILKHFFSHVYFWLNDFICIFSSTCRINEPKSRFFSSVSFILIYFDFLHGCFLLSRIPCSASIPFVLMNCVFIFM